MSRRCFLCPAAVFASLWSLGSRQLALAVDEPEPNLQEIVVTGSRIPVPANITATSPIQVVTAQDIALAGQTDTVNILNSLPQTVINSGIDFGNNSSPLVAAGGIATADDRGLGPQRTIVLVDGRRLGIGDPNTNNPNPAPDLDQIPTALIERVEVLTGDASATYGSDAIAGVVNFIMKRNFEGIQLDGQYGFDQHHQQNYYLQDQEAAAGITPPTGNIVDGYKGSCPSSPERTWVTAKTISRGTSSITTKMQYPAQRATSPPVRPSARITSMRAANPALPASAPPTRTNS